MKLTYMMSLMATLMITSITDAQQSIADAIRSHTSDTVNDIASALIRIKNDNFVKRPWGGFSLAEYKGMTNTVPERIGESFEIAAFPKELDKEAGENPSIVLFNDGSYMPLLELLYYAGDALLGSSFIKNYGKQIPLLPKVLDIAQLLSLQAHPPGNTETYIIIKADPGATLRLGFKKTVSDLSIMSMAQQGRALQESLLEYIRSDAPQPTMYEVISNHFSQRSLSIDALMEALHDFLIPGYNRQVITNIVSQLKTIYWFMLDQLHEIEVQQGQVIHNATPARFLSEQEIPSAEVHALGNEKQREILAIEIRRPGVTYRLWDNARFPLRTLDIDAALSALNLNETQPEDFLVIPQPIKAGVERLVESSVYTIERLTIQPGDTITQVTDNTIHVLLAIQGTINFTATDGRLLGSLTRGESGLMPITIEDYMCSTNNEKAVLIKVYLPL